MVGRCCNEGQLMDTINMLLSELAEEHYQSVADADYSSYLDSMMAEYNAQMYAANSYDLDAISYGE